MRAIIIGEAPGPQRLVPEADKSSAQPFSGRADKRMRQLIGDDWRERVAAINLFETWSGQLAKGSAFPVVEARRRAKSLRVLLEASGWDGNLILCGKRVARAFTGIPIHQIEYMSELINDEPWRSWCIPHPSGINRFWNEKGSIDSVKEFLATLVRD